MQPSEKWKVFTSPGLEPLVATLSGETRPLEVATSAAYSGIVYALRKAGLLWVSGREVTVEVEHAAGWIDPSENSIFARLAVLALCDAVGSPDLGLDDDFPDWTFSRVLQ